MVFEPRSREEIFEDVSASIRSESDQVTNFTPGSFNALLLNAYADEIRELELELLAAKLAGSVEYAGRTMTQSDLADLGIEGANPGDINRYMSDDHLDMLAENVGVEREEAEYARTELEFEVTGPDIEIEHGFRASTDAGDNERLFYVDATGNIIGSDGELRLGSSETVEAEETEDGDWVVYADAVAAEPGPRFNVPDNTITHIPNPRAGIISVTNTSAATGGDTSQTTESLRRDVSNALFESSVGGTRPGLEGALQREIGDDLDSLELIEFTDQEPPYVDVLAEGGDQEDLVDSIREFRPLGIRHNLLRPASVGVGVGVDIIGDVNEASVVDEIEAILNGSEIGESLFWSSLVSRISSSFFDIASISALNTVVDSVELEHIIYEDGTTEYEFNYAPFGRIRDEQYLVTQPRIDDGFELMYEAETSGDYEYVTVRARTDGTSRELDAGDEFTIDDDVLYIDSSIDLDIDSVLTVDYITDVTSTYGINSVYRAPKNVGGEADMRHTELEIVEDYDIISSDSPSTPIGIDISPSDADFEDRDRIVVDYEPAISEGRDILVNEGESLAERRVGVMVVEEGRGDDIV